MFEMVIEFFTVIPSPYTHKLFVSIPENYYRIALIGFIIGTVILVSQIGLKQGLKWGCGLLLAEYVFLLLCSTVFFRRASAVAGFNFIPFKTYQEIINGKDLLLPQCIMNVLVFIPIGVLLSIVAKKWYVALAIGVLLSLCIEMLQYLLAKGFCEIDDVIHNALGCLVGIGLYWFARRSYLLLK